MRYFKIFKRQLFIFIAYFISGNKSVFKCKINAFCRFNGNESFGNNVNFNGCKVYGRGKITFGDNFHSAKGLKFLTSYHNYKGNSIPYDHTVIVKDIIIGENVWIGMDVMILGGVSIGEGAIIQAGSVVSKSIPCYAIAGGNPARSFSERNKDSYLKLKKEKKFV